MSQENSGRQLTAWRRRQHLIFLGYSEAEIARLGDLTKITNEHMNELVQSSNLESKLKAGQRPEKTAPDKPVLSLGIIDGHIIRNVYRVLHARPLSAEK